MENAKKTKCHAFLADYISHSTSIYKKYLLCRRHLKNYFMQKRKISIIYSNTIANSYDLTFQYHLKDRFNKVSKKVLKMNCS